MAFHELVGQLRLATVLVGPVSAAETSPRSRAVSKAKFRMHLRSSTFGFLVDKVEVCSVVTSGVFWFLAGQRRAQALRTLVAANRTMLVIHGRV